MVLHGGIAWILHENRYEQCTRSTIRLISYRLISSIFSFVAILPSSSKGVSGNYSMTEMHGTFIRRLLISVNMSCSHLSVITVDPCSWQDYQNPRPFSGMMDSYLHTINDMRDAGAEKTVICIRSQSPIPHNFQGQKSERITPWIMLFIFHIGCLHLRREYCTDRVRLL